VTLKPGDCHTVRVLRLADARRFWYWTEPGAYTVTAEFTTAVAPPPEGSRVVRSEGGERFGTITLRSAPLTIPVETR
jgi:hypothetical protein